MFEFGWFWFRLVKIGWLDVFVGYERDVEVVVGVDEKGFEFGWKIVGR